MIHVLMDDGEFVGLIANLDTATVVEATRLVDAGFRKAIDTVPAEDLERAICHHIDLHYERSMFDWHDVLMAYLVKAGWHPSGIPPGGMRATEKFRRAERVKTCRLQGNHGNLSWLMGASSRCARKARRDPPLAYL